MSDDFSPLLSPHSFRRCQITLTERVAPAGCATPALRSMTSPSTVLTLHNMTTALYLCTVCMGVHAPSKEEVCGSCATMIKKSVVSCVCAIRLRISLAVRYRTLDTNTRGKLVLQPLKVGMISSGTTPSLGMQWNVGLVPRPFDLTWFYTNRNGESDPNWDHKKVGWKGLETSLHRNFKLPPRSSALGGGEGIRLYLPKLMLSIVLKEFHWMWTYCSLNMKLIWI